MLTEFLNQEKNKMLIKGKEITYQF
jgi:hypothetical protein